MAPASCGSDTRTTPQRRRAGVHRRRADQHRHQRHPSHSPRHAHHSPTPRPLVLGYDKARSKSRNAATRSHRTMHLDETAPRRLASRDRRNRSARKTASHLSPDRQRAVARDRRHRRKTRVLSIEAWLHGGIATLLALAVALFLSEAPTRAGRYGAALACAALLTEAAALPFVQHRPALATLLQLAGSASLPLFWLFARSWFEDDFRPGVAELAMALGYLGVSAAVIGGERGRMHRSIRSMGFCTSRASPSPSMRCAMPGRTARPIWWRRGGARAWRSSSSSRSSCSGRSARRSRGAPSAALPWPVSRARSAW